MIRGFLFSEGIFRSLGDKKQGIIVGNKAKERISKRVFQEKKARQIFRKTNIFYPLVSSRTRACQGLKKVGFPENLTCFVFLKHPFSNSPFCLITDELGDFYFSS